MNVSVFGAGAWGTALAVHAARLRGEVKLWARDATQTERMQAERRNARYLGEVALPAGLDVTADFDAAVEHARGGLVVVATPMAGLGDVLQALASREFDGDDTGVVWLSKGFQQGSGWLGHELGRELLPRRRVGVLSGPSFALEVARGQPTALVAASFEPTLAEQTVAALHGGALRIYTSADPIGVEVGGAVKNVLAIATGIADGMPAPEAGAPRGLGMNARAALVTRGLAEMTRLGVALGGRAETFMGLSGLGDLVLTATGALSRNRKVGLLLAEGLPLDRILAELGHVAEGVASAATVVARARALGVEMPIAEAVVDVLEGRHSTAEAVEQLMGRDARAEH